MHSSQQLRPKCQNQVGVILAKIMKALSLFLTLLVSVPVLAHHNYRLRFDYDNNVTMTGVVTNFDWKNPDEGLGFVSSKASLMQD